MSMTQAMNLFISDSPISLLLKIEMSMAQHFRWIYNWSEHEFHFCGKCWNTQSKTATVSFRSTYQAQCIHTQNNFKEIWFKKKTNFKKFVDYVIIQWDLKNKSDYAGKNTLVLVNLTRKFQKSSDYEMIRIRRIGDLPYGGSTCSPWAIPTSQKTR